MNITEKAMELGKMLRDSDELNRFKMAEENFLNNNELYELYTEYKKAYNKYQKLRNPDMEAEINRKYDTLLSSPVYIEYLESKNSLTELLDKVNGLVNFYMEDQIEFKTKSCSGCSGCK